MQLQGGIMEVTQSRWQSGVHASHRGQVNCPLSHLQAQHHRKVLTAVCRNRHGHHDMACEHTLSHPEPAAAAWPLCAAYTSTNSASLTHSLARHSSLHTTALQNGSRRSIIAASSASISASPGGGNSGSAGDRVSAFVQAFWKFVRPHTIRGTILGTTAVTTRALLEHPELIDWGLLPRALLGLVALLCGNGYIVGINQVYDVEIDAVNKPYLPIASGELKPALAWMLVLGLAAGGLTLTSLHFGPLITSLYAFGLFLGTIYSIPPFRLKAYAVPAFLIIATVRGFLLNFGVYYATRAALGLPFQWSPAITFITCFVTVFATVIAITKDLPDVEGDRLNGITTFATRLGVRNVSLLASGLLGANYVGAAVLALQQPTVFNVPLMAGAHAIMAVVLAYRTYRLDQEQYSQGAILSYYRWIWNLFYTEYLLLPWI